MKTDRWVNVHCPHCGFMVMHKCTGGPINQHVCNNCGAGFEFAIGCDTIRKFYVNSDPVLLTLPAPTAERPGA